MDRPLTRVLSKIFVSGFYRTHAGLFLVIFLMLFGVVEPGQQLFYHKSLMLAFITGPLMALAVSGIWFLYTLKSCHYIVRQISSPPQQFLFYSITSYSKKNQVRAWAATQFAILLPVIIYGLLASVVAIAYEYYLIALLIPLYLLFLLIGSAYFYTTVINQLIRGHRQTALLAMTKKWNKPYFYLFIYHVFDRLKIIYLITKGLSWLIVIGVSGLFADAARDLRVAEISVLGIAAAHSILIFERHRFETIRTGFARNLPYSRLHLYFGFALMYLILLFPEGIWLFSRFSPVIAFLLLLMIASFALLFHSILYVLGFNMRKYLQWIMALFIIVFWLIMFKFSFWLVPINLGMAWLLFYKNYYHSFTGTAQP